MRRSTWLLIVACMMGCMRAEAPHNAQEEKPAERTVEPIVPKHGGSPAAPAPTNPTSPIPDEASEGIAPDRDFTPRSPDGERAPRVRSQAASRGDESESSTPPDEAFPNSVEAAETADDESESSAPPDEAFPSSVDAADTADDGEVETDSRNRVVRVFYATDREPTLATELSGQRYSLTFYRAPGIGGLVTAVFLLCAILSHRRVMFGLIAVVSLGCTLWLLQSATLNVQRRNRATEFGDRTYGAGRHVVDGVPTLELGVCDVSLPPDHRVGQVETPSLLRLEFREDAEKHVIIQRTVRLPAEEFYEDLSAVVKKSTLGEAFLFIHGYNVGFEHAIRRTAQIAYDLEFDGAPICYSWPSQGETASYIYDEANVEWAVLQCEQLLRETKRRSGARTIHIIAHSMGNRILMQAMERMAQADEATPLFGEVVLAAPDVDAGAFRNRYFPAVAKLAGHVTLYASSNDRALRASTSIHGNNRAGLSGGNLVVIQGLDTIDASPIDTSLIGHSYYGNNPKMIRDLQTVVTKNTPAEARAWLKRVLRGPEYHYWVFDADFEPSP